MFHHRSGGTVQIVALMAAHRAARRDRTGLQQHEIARVIGALEMPEGPLPARRPNWSQLPPPRPKPR